MTDYAIIGGGNIGEALLSGIIGEEGGDAKSVIVADPSEARLEQLKEKYEVLTTTDGEEAAKGASMVFLCVKPDVVPTVCTSIAGVLENNDEDTVVVSVAAGVTLAAMEFELPAGTPVVRVMPNTPMLVGKGASGMAGGRFAKEGHLNAVQEVLNKVGTAVVVKEKDLDAVTAISGSAPAYFFLVVESMIDAGVQLGLTRPVAEQLAIATADGAATMMAKGLSEGGDDPFTLRTKVTSPGGTTAAGLRALEENGIRSAFFRGMQAVNDRSAELGKS